MNFTERERNESWDWHTGLPNVTFNRTSTLEPRPAQWLFLSLAIVPCWVIFGNFLVLMAVVCQRSLRTLSNYVIASLAFTDLMVALVVVPFGIYQIVSMDMGLNLNNVQLFVIVHSWVTICTEELRGLIVKVRCKSFEFPSLS